jgi:MtrB/PioB family decaheme-associated outer membrane protein|nr:MtrB/PioB family decaheme-associated outer membrane protein [Rhodoferax sp.]
MTKTTPMFVFQRTALALALCAAFVPAQAQSSSDQSSVSIGVGLVSGDRDGRAQFSQYSGVRKENATSINLGAEFSRRDEETVSWIDFLGTDLLNDSRDMSLVWKDVGNWKLNAEYGELTRQNPDRVNTGLAGAGTSRPIVTALPGGPGTGANFDLQTKRTKLGVGFAKIITPRLQIDIDLKSENKRGSQMFGIGMNCPTSYNAACLGTTGNMVGGATLLLPELIDSNHSQIETRLSYALEKLRFNIGYYGSFYRNTNATMNPTVSGNLYNAVGSLFSVSPGLLGYLNQAVALTPDNQMHQFDASGNYEFSDKTRGVFKLAQSLATQDETFGSVSRTGLTSLGGSVKTQLAHLGVTSRPIDKLSLQADVRYRNKDDQTPLAYYNLAGTLASTNQQLSSRKIDTKVQASWQFSSDYRGSLAANSEVIDRGTVTPSASFAGISALRQNTRETGVQAELRRRLSDDFSGAISLSRSQRDGTNWLRDLSGLGVAAVSDVADPSIGFSSALFSPTLADRRRDKVKIYGDWMPDKDWSIQISAENGNDFFNTPSQNGLKQTRMNQLAIDASYALSFRWALNGYLSRGLQTFNQSRNAGYVMAFENTNTNVGLGFTGKPTNEIEVGGTLSYVDDKSQYVQTLDAAADPYTAASLAATGGLPDIMFQQTALKFFGKFALDKQTAVRVDLIHQRTHFNDWAWGYVGVPYTYADGTTVSQRQQQNVNFLGVSYIYQLR